MEDSWLNGILRNLKTNKDSRVNREVVIIRGDEQEFMQSYVTKVQEENDCFFQAPVSTSQDYYYYPCERANRASGKSKGESTKTRANSCGAYISFKLIKDAGFSGSVINQMLQHTGHDLSNPQERVKNRIDPELLAFVEMWLRQGFSISKTLLKSCEWADKKGYKDKHNTRFYLSPADVRLIKRGVRALTLSDIKDCVSVDKLATCELKDNICFYQPLTNHQPLMIVVQTPSQKNLLKDHPNPMVFMDASYKGITSYGYALYALLLINATGRGVPFAYFILSEESTETISCCLQKLVLSNPSFYPRSVMIDRDLKEINAIRQIFPETNVLLCWFHVLQAVNRWLLKRDGGNVSAEQRNMVIHAMASIKTCKTEEEFLTVSAMKCRELEAHLGNKQVTTYLKTHWFPYAALWSNFGRTFYHHNSETNNKAERFFLTLKYQFLRGEANKRIDQLLILLCGDVQKYFCYLDDLADAGRLNIANDTISSAAVKDATAMSETGFGAYLTIDEHGKCSLPSESSPNLHTVDLVTVQCDCKIFGLGNLCKHILFSKMEAQKRGVDIECLRKIAATHIVKSQLYHFDDDILSIFHKDGTVSVVNSQSPSFCTCKANSHGEKCVCLHVFSILRNEAIPTHVIVQNDDKMQRKTDMVPKPTVQAMLTDLLEWSQSENYNENNELYKTVARAHNLVFSNFAIISRKRKISALHAYRQRIKKAKSTARENFKHNNKCKTHNLRLNITQSK